jgi:8-oxo-dGTP pyrophosphatase MutT (NUDIX family)
MNTNENYFLPPEQFNPDDFPDHVVVRWIIIKLGKTEDDTFIFLHERPDWSKLEKLKLQLYGGSRKNDETPEQTARRELREELRINDKKRETLGAQVTGKWVNYYFLLTRKITRPIRDKSNEKHDGSLLPSLKDRPLGNGWFSVADINSGKLEIAFNHVEVINAAVTKMRARENV